MALQAVEAVGGVHRSLAKNASSGSRQVLAQYLVFGRVHFEQAQAVVRPDGLQGQPGRAGVNVCVAIGIQRLYCFQVRFNHGRHAGLVQKTIQAVDEFAVFHRPLAAQIVEPGSGMGINNPVGVLFLVVVIQQVHKNAVFQHISMVACVKGMSVTEQNISFWPLRLRKNRRVKWFLPRR